MEQLFGKTTLSVVEDPFNAECIDSIVLRCDRKLFNKDEFEFRGHVDFERNNTEGTQRFTANNLGELYEKIAEFCKSLE
jgi:hypothetical protein